MMAEGAEPRPAVCELRVPIGPPDITLCAEQRDGDAGRTPFVLVHGLASNLRLWDGVAARLHAAGHTVVALDQRGHGRSAAPETPYGLDTAVRDLLGTIDALNLQRPVLVGQSWGGNVVLELAWRRPERVCGIACVDGGIIELADWFPSWEACLATLTPPQLDGMRRAELEARLRQGHPRFQDWAVEAALANFRFGPNGEIEPRLARQRHLQILHALWQHRPSTRLPTLRTPVLLVLADTGDAAHTSRKRHAEARALGSARRIRSHWFSPGDHDLHAERPAEVAELLTDAVREGFFA